MLFYIKYINHDVEKLQELLVYFFNKVEVNNPENFDKELLPNWYNDASNKMKDLEGKLSEFINFPEELKTSIINAFKDANEIETLFGDKNKAIPVALDFDKNKEFLSEFFTKLYKDQLSKKTDSSAPFPKIIQTDLADHYKTLKTKNRDDRDYGNFTVCPFCGIEPYTLPESEERPPYDHLLPEGSNLFVFSTVNLKNLFPIGTHCNKLKNTESLLYEDAERTIRTLAFYPYDTVPHPFKLIKLQLECIKQPEFKKNGDWCVKILPKNPQDSILIEKIATWVRVFKIEKRYQEYIQERDNTWIENLLKTYKSIESTSDEINRSINNDLQISFSFISITEGLIPRRMFYQWTLEQPKFLNDFLASFKNIPTNVIDNDLTIEDTE